MSLKYLDLSFDDGTPNLACDEALLELCAASRFGADGVLRLWEPGRYFVVLGHANRRDREADVEACTRDGIAMLRRISGGGAVLQGPGCVNYTLVLRSAAFNLTGPQRAFDVVLDRHRDCLRRLLGQPVEIRGVSDLAVDGRKFSGNAQYRKRDWVLVHGTFLLQFDLGAMADYLRSPSRAPDYRGERGHEEFVTNVGVHRSELGQALRAAWSATDKLSGALEESIARLVRDRYGQAQWNDKF